MTIVPLVIITWVLIRLFSQTFQKISLSNIILGFSFVLIWGIVIFKLQNEFEKISYCAANGLNFDVNKFEKIKLDLHVLESLTIFQCKLATIKNKILIKMTIFRHFHSC